MRCVWLFSFLLFCCTACRHSPDKADKQLSIRLNADSQHIAIYGISYATMQELKKDSLTNNNLQTLFPVYAMPADKSAIDIGMQKEQPGTYLLTNTTITFKPDTAFKKHRQYLARFYGKEGITVFKLIRSKANLKGPEYIEQVFKF